MIVYVQTSGENITAVNSFTFLNETEGWTQIDEGTGDKYHHAQGNYLEKGLIDDDGCYNYKLIDGVVTERTAEEKQAEIAARPPVPPTPEERLRNAEDVINFLLGL